MKEEILIEQLLKELQNKGSQLNKEELKNIKKDVIKAIKKEDPEESLKTIIENTKQEIEKLIDTEKNIIDGISACIYLPDPTGEYKLKFFGGKTSNKINAQEIDNNTLFDIASITKMYTLVLVFSMIENKWIHPNTTIKEIDNTYKNLNKYTIDDIIKMTGIIKTSRRIDEATTKEEAEQILKTTYIEEYNPNKNNYTDIGFTILSDIIPKIINQKTNQELTYQQIMEKYIFEPFEFKNTQINPTNKTLAGNAGLTHVQDPKAKILGGITGAAGIFTNADDLAKLAQKLYTVKYSNYTYLMGKIIFEGKNANKGNAGIYQKHEEGLKRTFVPNSYATGSFAHQGYTGSVAIFDPKNKIHNSILVSAIKEGETKKTAGFQDACDAFNLSLSYNSLKAYLIKKYYQETYKEKQTNIEKEIKVK